MQHLAEISKRSISHLITLMGPVRRDGLSLAGGRIEGMGGKKERIGRVEVK